MQVRGRNRIATDNVQYRVLPRIGFAWDVFGPTAIRSSCRNIMAIRIAGYGGS